MAALYHLSYPNQTYFVFLTKNAYKLRDNFQSLIDPTKAKVPFLLSVDSFRVIAWG